MWERVLYWSFGIILAVGGVVLFHVSMDHMIHRPTASTTLRK